MSGRDALRGFQYQILRTLEHVLTCMRDSSSQITSVHLETPTEALDPVWQDIVDFALMSESRRAIVAQVKSSRTTRSLTGLQAVRHLVRLVMSGPADCYLLISNQVPAEIVRQVASALERDNLSNAELMDLLVAACGGHQKLERELRALRDDQTKLLSRCKIQMDSRSEDETREHLRDLIRELRRKAGVRTGPGSSGLMLGYLTSLFLAGGASQSSSQLSFEDVWGALAVANSTLVEAWGRRDWGRVIGSLPRLGDVGRPELVSLLREKLLTSTYPGVASCALVGPSGIGKSTLASEFLAEFADYFDLIVWVNAISRPLVRRGFDVLARALGLESDPRDADETIASAVRAELHNTSRRWAIVFDNAVSRSSIEMWIPPSGSGVVLVTSTGNSGWAGPGFTAIEVGGMTIGESTALLRNRLLEGQPDLSQRAALEAIAEALSRWPLALELGANYMRSCGFSLAESDQFIETLRFRALRDQESTPMGYPVPLVVALKDAYRRLVDRAADEPISELTLLLTKYSAFTLERQIPLDLLLMSATLEPYDATAERILGPHEWRHSEFPLNEILRAAERDFWIRRDEPLDLQLDMLKPSVQVNQIVQFVIREIVTEEDPDGMLENSILYHLSFYLQSWVSWFTERDGIVAAVPLLEHAEHVADGCIDRDVMNLGVALLLGNLSTVLHLTRRLKKAEAYLAVELRYLDSQPELHFTIRLQARVAQASVLWDSRADAGDAAHHVSEALKNLKLAAVELEGALSEGSTPALKAGVLSAVLLLDQLQSRQYSVEIDQLRSRFAAASGRLDPDTETGVMQRPLILHELWVKNDYDALISTCEPWLVQSSTASVLRPTYLRMLAEAFAAKARWADVMRIMSEVYREVLGGRFRGSDVSTLIVNVGLSATIAILESESSDACVAMREVLRSADLSELLHGSFNDADQSCIRVSRAVDAIYAGHERLFDRYVRDVNFSALELVDPNRLEAWRELYFVVAYLEVPRQRQILAAEGPEQGAPQGAISKIEAMREVVTSTFNELDRGGLDVYNLVDEDEIEIGEGLSGSIYWKTVKDGAPCNGVLIGTDFEARLGVIGRVLIATAALAQCEIWIVQSSASGALRAFEAIADRNFATLADARSTLTSIADSPEDRQRLDVGVGHRHVLLVAEPATGLAEDVDLADSLSVLAASSLIGVVLVLREGSLLEFGGSIELRETLSKPNFVVLP